MPVKSCTEQPLLSGFFEKKYYSQFCRTSVRTAREAAVLIPVGWKCVRAVTYPISFSLATKSSIAHIPATPQGYAALRALTPQFSETKKYYSQFCRTSVRTARDAAVLIPVGWKCVRAVTYPISFSLATNSSIFGGDTRISRQIAW